MSEHNNPPSAAPFEYEDISNADRHTAVQVADETLDLGWSRRGYDLLRLDQPIPWDLIKPAERSWNFNIHCWDMLDRLLKAHSETGADKYLEPALSIALDWIRQDVAEGGHASPFAWYDMAVGLRAYRLAYLLDAARRQKDFVQTALSALEQALDKHAVYLADDANIVFHNNHGLYQVAGQIAMGRRFADVSPAMAAALQQGQERLNRIIGAQFASDGIHLEHSPDYHRMVYLTLKEMSAAGLILDPDIAAKVLRIETALSWFILPNRHLANFGDSDYRRMARNPAAASRTWNTPEMRFMVSGGAVGALPEADHAVFPEGGYFVARRPDLDRPGEVGRYSYLAQTAAFHSRTHKHADDLSFIWSDRGRDILVDAGRYGYIGKAKQDSDLWRDGYWYDDPKRVYVESTRAHNALEFDGRDHRRKGVRPYGSALGRVTRTPDGVFAVESEVRHGSIRHARTLIFNPGQWLIVFDWHHDNDAKPHDVRQWFHLAPDLAPLWTGDGYVVPGEEGETPLRITGLLEGPSPSLPILARDDDPMQGWWSPKERELIPAYAFCYETSGQTTGSTATLFTFSNELSRIQSASRVSTSGRAVHLQWITDIGQHSVSLQRPKDEIMTLTYILNKSAPSSGKMID